jgi:hypothetical protein
LNFLKITRHRAARAARTIAEVAGRAGSSITAARNVHYFLLQIAGTFAVLYGISYWSVPIALIVGGVGAIVAVELQTHEPEPDIDQILAIQARIKTALASGQDPFATEGVPFTPTWVAYASSLRVQR